MMTELWIALGVGLPIALCLTAVAWFQHRADRASTSLPTLGPSGRVALLTVPSLDRLENEPQIREALRGRVRSIYVMSLPTFTSSGQAGNSVVRNSGLFLVDTEGALHEPAGFRRPLELEALGRQLAQDLGVPFQMR